MRFVAPAALLTAGLLVAASASADNGAAPPSAPPPVAAPPPAALPPAAPALAAPPLAPLAPAYPAPPAYAPGYPPPYMMYLQPGAGAPPPYWMPIAPPTERRSNAMRTTGIVLFAASGLTTAVGGVIIAAISMNPCVDVFLDESAPTPAREASRERVRSARQALNACDTDPAIGLGLMTAGLVTAAVGIPLFVIGSKQVPARTMTGKLTPEVRVGAANGSLRWSF